MADLLKYKLAYFASVRQYIKEGGFATRLNMPAKSLLSKRFIFLTGIPSTEIPEFVIWLKPSGTYKLFQIFNYEFISSELKKPDSKTYRHVFLTIDNISSIDADFVFSLDQLRKYFPTKQFFIFIRENLLENLSMLPSGAAALEIVQITKPTAEKISHSVTPNINVSDNSNEPNNVNEAELESANNLDTGTHSIGFAEVPNNITENIEIPSTNSSKSSKGNTKKSGAAKRKGFEPTRTEYDDLFREAMQTPLVRWIAGSENYLFQSYIQPLRDLTDYDKIISSDSKLASRISELRSEYESFPGTRDEFGKQFMPNERLTHFWKLVCEVTELILLRFAFNHEATGISILRNPIPAVLEKQIISFILSIYTTPLSESEYRIDYINLIGASMSPGATVYVFRETDRAKMVKSIFGKDYDPEFFISTIYGYFESLSANHGVKNSDNLGLYVTAVLYYPPIAALWQTTLPPQPKPAPAKAPASVLFNSGTTVSTYYEDKPSANDYLGFKPDVEALSALAAFRKTPLPLAIALFGNWGSGKSSFMEQMQKRMDELGKLESEIAGEKPEQKETPFCSKIVHVTFNAWHYADANLWASLMARIFEKLQSQLSPEEKDAFKNKLKAELETAKAISSVAQTDIEHASRLVSSKKEELDGFETKKDQIIRDLSTIGTKDVAELVKQNPAYRQAIGQLNSSLDEKEKIQTENIEQAIADITNLKSSLIRTGSRTKKIVERFRSENIWVKSMVLFFAFGAPLFLVAAPFIPQLKNAVLTSQLGSFLVFIATGITGIVRFISPALKLWNEQLDKVEKAENEIRLLRQREEEKLLKEEHRLSSELQRLQQDLALAKKQYDEAKEKEERLKNELADFNLDRQLIKFIRSRQGSDGYEKHLGIISVIRKDFENLSKLLGIPDNADDVPEKQPLVDRIVLYIDDLDRCKSERVVEVLEAVHLLMAFKIFVVVVGVDPRWVTKALRKKHEEQFGENDDSNLQLPGKQATTFDYLEKIFQVPFVVRPMQNDGARQLLDRLFLNQVRPKESKTETLELELTDEQGNDAGTVQLEMQKEDENNPSANPQPPQPTAEEIAAEEKKQHEEKLRVVREQAQSLMLSQEELDFMKELAPLTGQTPRTVIRFANIYRILRVHEKTPVYNESGEESLQHLKAILLLLAVATGCGNSAEKFFSGIKNTGEKELGDFWKKLDNTSDKTIENWNIFLGKKDSEIYKFPVELLREYAPIVARFSFRTIHISETEELEETAK